MANDGWLRGLRFGRRRLVKAELWVDRSDAGSSESLTLGRIDVSATRKLRTPAGGRPRPTAPLGGSRCRDGRLRRPLLCASAKVRSTQRWRRLPLFMPHTCRSRYPPGSDLLGGLPTFAGRLPGWRGCAEIGPCVSCREASASYSERPFGARQNSDKANLSRPPLPRVIACVALPAAITHTRGT